MGNKCKSCDFVSKTKEAALTQVIHNDKRNDTQLNNMINIATTTHINDCSPNATSPNGKAKIINNLTSTTYNNLTSLFTYHNDNEDPIEENQVKIIQATYRGFLFKKKYPSLKIFLKCIENKLIKETMMKMVTPLLTQGDALLDKFEVDNWKKYYDEKDKEAVVFNYDYGRTLNANILIKQNANINFCYVGSINIYSQRHGVGMLILCTGEKYEGMWRNDSFYGWGRHITTEGTVSEGLFVNWLLTGKGIKKTLNSYSYIGEFQKSQREGKAVEETEDYIYEGFFSKDKKNGLGKVKYKHTNDSYEGIFSDNEITGIGTYCWGSGNVYTGDFLKGKMHGKGKYKWVNGEEYEGEYIYNIKQGKGSFKWVDGRIFKGFFKDGKPHGSGRLLIENVEHDVEFINGTLQGKMKNILRKNSRNSVIK